MAVKGVAGLEEALWNMYVEEEYFENENLYRCGACDKLVEASKVIHWRSIVQLTNTWELCLHCCVLPLTLKY